MISHIPDDISMIIKKFADDSKKLLRGHVIGEYLFGSYATNKYSQLSDIDILIIVDKLTPELRWQMSGLASDYSLEYDIYISPIIKDKQVWMNNQKYNTLFYQEVVQNGISL